MPRVSAKKADEPAPVAPAPVAPAPAQAEKPAKKAGARFTKMTEEHKAHLEAHKDASKHFKASLRGNLMIGKTYEQALEKAKALDEIVKARQQSK
jgi:hypothetical protein